MDTVKQQIKHRWSGAVLFECEVDASLSPAKRLGEAVKQVLASRANLTRANLTYADLRGADLTRASLSGANLRGANLRGANLRGANLTRANLTRANLTRANLSGANLSGANLSVAKLTRAKLTGAIFSQANFAGASLIAKRILDGGLRSDGWRFFLWWDSQRGWRVRAGCRDFNLAEARSHWTTTRGGTTLGQESLAILDHLERLAAIRGWDLSEAPKAEIEGK